jgi:hypothetical protein
VTQRLWQQTLTGLCLLILVGCSSARQLPETLALIAPDRPLSLPSPGDLGRSLDAVQLITIRREGNTQTFEARISVTPDRFLLTGSDSFGRRALTITWDKSGKISAQTAGWVPDSIPPGPLLADIVVLYWPEGVVRRALDGSGATLIVASGARALVADDATFWHAKYPESDGPSWSGKLCYRNDAWGYEIEVQSVEVTP